MPETEIRVTFAGERKLDFTYERLLRCLTSIEYCDADEIRRQLRNKDEDWVQMFQAEHVAKQLWSQFEELAKVQALLSYTARLLEAYD